MKKYMKVLAKHRKMLYTKIRYMYMGRGVGFA